MESWDKNTLTHRDQVALVLQRDISGQSPLYRAQAFPFLPREVYGHILKCQYALSQKRTVLSGTQVQSSLFHLRKQE